MKAYVKTLLRRGLALCRPRTLVLGYHHVCESGQSAPWITASPGRFAEHMAFLSREGLTAPLDHLLADLRRGRFERRPRVVVTFDDAAADLFDNALPILTRYGVPATLFIPTGLVGSNKPFWWNRLYLLGRTAENRGLEFGAMLEGAGASLPPRTPASNLWHTLRFLEDEQREKILGRCAELLEVSQGGARPMTWDQIRHLDRTGLVTFGAHTVTHPPLAAVAPGRAGAEVSGSRDELNRFASFRPVFAYPYGDAPAVNRQTRKLIRSAGFDGAFTTQPRAVGSYDNRMALGRVCVDDMSLAEFRWVIDRHLCR